MAYRVGGSTSTQRLEGSAINTEEILHGLELDTVAAQSEAERAKEIAEAAHQRLDKVEAAIRALSNDPGSPWVNARAARDILDGELTW